MKADWLLNKRLFAELDLSSASIYKNAYATAGGPPCSTSVYDAPPYVVCCDGAELNLARNSTSYMAYIVDAPSMASFNVSINFTASDTSGHVVSSTVYIQPWDSYPAAATSSSSTVPIITGSIQLSGIKSEDYTVLQQGYALIQTSLEDAGETIISPLLIVFQYKAYILNTEDWLCPSIVVHVPARLLGEQLFPGRLPKLHGHK